MSVEVLKSLQKPILKKLEPATIANLSDVLFAYSTASPDMLETKNDLALDDPNREVGFVHQVQKALNDKVILLDHFNTLNSTKAVWALSRYQAHSLVPNYHLDVANVLLSRQDIGKVSSVSHAIYKDIGSQILEKKKMSTALNQSISMYAQASVGYHNEQFFEQAFMNYKQHEQVPTITDLGYMA